VHPAHTAHWPAVRQSTKSPVFTELLSNWLLSIIHSTDCEVHLVIGFWTQKTFPLPKSIANPLKSRGKVPWARGLCVSCVDYLMGEGQMCTLRRILNACLSSSRIWKAGTMLMFVKTDDSLLMSFMKDLSQMGGEVKETVTAANFNDNGTAKLEQHLVSFLNRNGGLCRKINICCI
jgi:hypothetical protein